MKVRKKPLEEEAMAKDPVCGMDVEVENAAAIVDHGGQTYYFCSKDCAEAFEDDPENYL